MKELLEEMKDIGFKLFEAEPLSTLAKRLRDICSEYERGKVVLECPNCAKLYAVEEYMDGLWCTSCAANPGHSVWIDGESNAASDERAEAFLKTLMLNDLKSVGAELATIANYITQLQTSINKLEGLYLSKPALREGR